MTTSEKARMLAGELYRPNDPEIRSDQAEAAAWLRRYNVLVDASGDERRALLAERFAVVGEGADIRPPFHCDFGSNIRLGANVFLNFNCVILDRRRSVPPCRSTPPTIRAMRRSAAMGWSSAGRCASAAMSGSAAGPSSCRA